MERVLQMMSETAGMVLENRGLLERSLDQGERMERRMEAMERRMAALEEWIKRGGSGLKGDIANNEEAEGHHAEDSNDEMQSSYCSGDDHASQMLQVILKEEANEEWVSDVQYNRSENLDSGQPSRSSPRKEQWVSDDQSNRSENRDSGQPGHHAVHSNDEMQSSYCSGDDHASRMLQGIVKEEPSEEWASDDQSNLSDIDSGQPIRRSARKPQDNTKKGKVCEEADDPTWDPSQADCDADDSTSESELILPDVKPKNPPEMPALPKKFTPALLNLFGQGHSEVRKRKLEEHPSDFRTRVHRPTLQITRNKVDVKQTKTPGQKGEYRCETCDMSFPILAHLKFHMKRHEQSALAACLKLTPSYKIT